MAFSFGVTPRAAPDGGGEAAPGPGIELDLS